MDWKAVAEDAHNALNFPLFRIGETSITPLTLLIVVVVLLITLQMSRWLQAGVKRGAKVRGLGVDQEGSVRVAQRLVHYSVLAIGIVVALQAIGINLSTLVAAGAVLGVGVGLAMQGLAQNFVSGIILLVERSIKPGDVVKVEGMTVRVVEMSIRSTICRTRDGEDVIVPNSLLVQNAVTNLTKDDRLIRVRCPVGVIYGADMAKVRDVLMHTARGVEWRRPEADPVLLWKGFGSSSVDWEISVWAEDPWRLPEYQTNLGIVVWDALKAAGITIAFPQVDVHFDRPVSDALQVIAGGRQK